MSVFIRGDLLLADTHIPLISNGTLMRRFSNRATAAPAVVFPDLAGPQSAVGPSPGLRSNGDSVFASLPIAVL